ARIASLSLLAGGIELKLEEEAEITLREGQAWLGSTRISGPDTSLTLSGTYDLRSAAAGVGTLSGRFDARLLRLLIPDLEAQGSVGVQIHANASGDYIVYGGRVSTASGWLNYPGLPTP